MVNPPNSISMKKSTQYIAIALSVCCFLFSLESTANNISVSSVSLIARNKTADYVQVQFNLSWNNSFRANTGPSNWDAAWVFIKFKVGVSGEWKHASISTTGVHLIPPGATSSQNNKNGLFIYRDANGTGNLSLAGVQLRWNYGEDGVGDDEKFYVKVFAVEMVLVPQGDFQVGSGGQNTGEFRQANDVSSSSTATTFTITSSAPTFQGNNSASSAANLSTRLGVGNDLSSGTTTATLGAGYPTGYAAFYCMKYEISQGQYRDFLNTLTYTQQVMRTAIAPSSAAGTGALISSGTDRNGIEIKSAGTVSTTPAVYGCDLSNNNTFDEAADGEWIACNYLSWDDVTAYLVWAALRPMTELEYEKACRGTVTPFVNEYAWGTATATSLAALLNTSQSTEASNTSGANLVSDDAFSGPVRGGIYATGSSTRIQAGSGYYGIMELSGNLWEQTVPLSNANARSFSNVMGNGTLASNGNADVSTWPDGADIGIRGGSYAYANTSSFVSDRSSIGAGVTARVNYIGGRGVISWMPNLPVVIGTQQWMKENLDVATYRNGDIIPQVTDATAWAALTTGAWCYYNNNPNNGAIFAKLYNWYAVNDSRGLAPAGWHIPTDAEWTTLSTYLGGTTVAGGKMKTPGTTRWISPNTGATNESGFTGLPGGFRYNNGPFGNAGYAGIWWSATQQDATYAWARQLPYDSGSLGRTNFPNKNGGFSVRCIKD
jgi:uncharacterized protein (TIGR02145 family)